MKILLLNDNPVVSKLVTLSSQKTSDELETVHSIEEVNAGQYDLLIIDDALYSEGLLDELKAKINFKKSLFIMAKNSQLPEGFTNTIKKPFLPTDLVELFSFLNKEVNEADREQSIDKFSILDEPLNENLMEEFRLDDDLEELEGLDDILDGDELDELEGLDSLNDLDGLEESEDLDELDATPNLILDTNMDLDEDEELILDEDIELDDNEELELDDEENLEDSETFSLEDELTLDDNEDFSLDDESTDGILDKDELQEVQDLLDDTETEEDELDIALNDLDNTDEDSLDIANDTMDEKMPEESSTHIEEELEDFTFEDDALEEEKETSEQSESDLDDEAGFEDELLAVEDESFAEELTEDVLDEEIDEKELEAKIEKAMSELSEEDLEEEIELDDEITQIPEDDLNDEEDAFASLSQRELKLAVGEEVEEISEEDENLHEPEAQEELESLEDEPEDEETDIEEEAYEEADDEESENDGVEALKNLLAALSDKKVAATLKGMKITINITLGDK